jgi:hypothetical protein
MFKAVSGAMFNPVSSVNINPVLGAMFNPVSCLNL